MRSGKAKTWREIARAAILHALEEAKAQGLDEKATLKVVDESYPFGKRAHYPYKVWLEERRALVTKRPKRVARVEFEGKLMCEREYIVTQGQAEMEL